MDELEVSPEQRAYEAKEVQLLLSKELVKEAWASTKRRITQEWEMAQTVTERENAWAKMQLFQTFKRELTALAGRPILPVKKE